MSEEIQQENPREKTSFGHVLVEESTADEDRALTMYHALKYMGGRQIKLEILDHDRREWFISAILYGEILRDPSGEDS